MGNIKCHSRSKRTNPGKKHGKIRGFAFDAKELIKISRSLNFSLLLNIESCQKYFILRGLPVYD